MSEKKRIAILIDWYLPGTKAGGPVRSVYSLVQLLKNDFALCIITSAFDLGAEKPYDGIRAGEVITHDGVQYYYTPGRRIRANELLSVFDGFRPDLVYLNSFWSVTFSLNLLRLRRAGKIQTPVILAPRGMLGSGALQLKALKKKLFLVAAKIARLHEDVVFHATQEGEASDIRRLFPHADIRLAPNVTSALPLPNRSSKHPNRLSLFYLSRISRVKNLHFALQALADVAADFEITYDIFGNIEDESYWQECLQLIAALPTHIRVNYRDELSFEKVQHTIAGYHALLLPTLNENYGHSIVESLMSGCMAIISDQTPWTDVNRFGSYAMPLAIRMDFTTAIQECARLDDAAFRARSSAAIEYISNRTDIHHAASRYKELFSGSIKN